MKEALNLFQRLSCLAISDRKCQIFFGGCSPTLKNEVKGILGFAEEKLPVRYLGLPLITNMLKSRDCKELVDKIQAKISQWYYKSLSFAGKVQLIQSVIGGMLNFWTSTFPLPMETIKEINGLLAKLLWGSRDQQKLMHKVKWKVCCRPKEDWGLGLCDVELNAKVSAFKSVWELLTEKDNI